MSCCPQAGWVETADANGDGYYWHPESRETRWERPVASGSLRVSKSARVSQSESRRVEDEEESDPDVIVELWLNRLIGVVLREGGEGPEDEQSDEDEAEQTGYERVRGGETPPSKVDMEAGNANVKAVQDAWLQKHIDAVESEENREEEEAGAEVGAKGAPATTSKPRSSGAAIEGWVETLDPNGKRRTERSHTAHVHASLALSLFKSPY